MPYFCICFSAWYCPVRLFRTSFTRPYWPDPMVWTTCEREHRRERRRVGGVSTRAAECAAATS
eukprot:4300411-Pyramimonas_sp.AAC.1